MSANAEKFYRSAFARVLLVVGTGMVIAGVATVMLSTLPQHWIFLAVGAVVLLMPSFVVKQVKLYWLAVYLLAFVVQGSRGKSLTKYFVDASGISDALGFPPGNLVIALLPSDVVLLGLALFWALRVAARREGMYFPKGSSLALAYLGWATISSVLKAPYPYLSLVELVQQYKYLLLYLYVANTVDSKKILKGLVSVLMVCLLVEATAVVASWKFNFGARLLSAFSVTTAEVDVEDVGNVFEGGGSGAQRPAGTFGPQGAAFYLHFLLPLALALLLTSEQTRKKVVYLFLFTLGTAALYLTYSRGALLAFGGWMVMFLWLAVRSALLSKWRAAVIVYTGVVLLCMSAPTLYSYMTSRPGTVTIRFQLWEQGTRMIEENPILGVGVNNSTAVKKEFGERVESESVDPLHNHYLTVAAESGVVGFMLYVGFFVLTAVEIFRLGRSADRDLACLAVAFLSTYIALSIQLVVDPLGNVAGTMLWFYTGLAAGLNSIKHQASGYSAGVVNARRVERLGLDAGRS